MIPLKDYNPTKHFPYLTVLLIAVNVVVFFAVQRPFSSTDDQEARFSYEVAAIPCEVVEGRPLTDEEIINTLDGDAAACERGLVPVTGAVCIPEDIRPDACEFAPEKRVWAAILYSMFLHGDILHIGGNMLFLWIFGNNIEDRMRTVPYLVFYLVAGLAATLAHIAVQPNSTIPMIGASGAVAGVMGAYLVLFPRVPIRTLLIFILILIRDIPAMWVLGFWFVLQFFTGENSGVAWVAHVGGFVFGALVALLLRERLRPPRVPQPAY